jgi:hypothetical protein
MFGTWVEFSNGRAHYDCHLSATIAKLVLKQVPCRSFQRLEFLETVQKSFILIKLSTLMKLLSALSSLI